MVTRFNRDCCTFSVGLLNGIFLPIVTVQYWNSRWVCVSGSSSECCVSCSGCQSTTIHDRLTVRIGIRKVNIMAASFYHVNAMHTHTFDGSFSLAGASDWNVDIIFIKEASTHCLQWITFMWPFQPKFLVQSGSEFFDFFSCDTYST